jgi:hypothetical protein
VATRRRLILEAIKTRLEAIRTADGFDTNLGRQVFLGEATELGPDDPEQAIKVVVGLDLIRWQSPGHAFLITLPIGIWAVAKADVTQAWLASESVIGDVKRAIELEDRTLGGLLTSPFERGQTQALERPPGSTTIGIGIGYMLLYKEGWGTP